MSTEKVNSPDDTLVQMNKLLLPSQTNAFSMSLLGGELLKWMDTCACLSAERHSRYPSVTASMDDLQFREKVKAGQLIRLVAKVHRAFNTSMEVGVNVFIEDPITNVSTIMCEAFFTFVSLGENGVKVTIPPLIPVSEQDKDQHSLANERRQIRLSRKTSIEKVAELLKSTSSVYSLRASLDARPTAGGQFGKNTPTNNSNKTNPNAVLPIETLVESWELVLPQHANHHGTAFGGQIMEWMEMSATISASRLCKTYPLLASIDDIHFLGAIKVGERIIITAQVNNSFTTSMEVGVRVDAIGLGEQEPRNVNTAYFTFVAINGDGKKARLPPLLAKTEEEIKRYDEAIARRQVRLDRRKIRNEKVELAVEWNENNTAELCLSNISNLTILKSTRDWDVLNEKDGIQLLSKDVGNTLVIRVEGTIDCPATELFHLLSDLSLRSEWDGVFESSSIHRRIDSENAIAHLKLKPKPGSDNKPQDFVLLISRKKPTDFSKHFVIAHRSILIPTIPPLEQYQRGEIGSSGFVITPDSNSKDKSHVVYMNQFGSSVLSYMAGDMIGVSSLLHETFAKLRDFASNVVTHSVGRSTILIHESVLTRMIDEEMATLDDLSEKHDRLFQPPESLINDIRISQARLADLRKQKAAVLSKRNVNQFPK